MTITLADRGQSTSEQCEFDRGPVTGLHLILVMPVLFKANVRHYVTIIFKIILHIIKKIHNIFQILQVSIGARYYQYVHASHKSIYYA